MRAGVRMSVCVRCPEALWLRWDWRRRFRNHALPEAQTPRGRGLVWSLPALSGGRGGEGVDAGLRVQLPEPDGTSLQCSLPWRKQIRNDRKQLPLTWPAEMQPQGAACSSQEYEWKVLAD